MSERVKKAVDHEKCTESPCNVLKALASLTPIRDVAVMHVIDAVKEKLTPRLATTATTETKFWNGTLDAVAESMWVMD